MKTINVELQKSDICLARIIDSINECLFYDKPVPKKDLKKAMRLIRSRQIINGDYTGQLSFTPADFDFGSRLFTGEKLQTKLAIKNILNQESIRLLGIFDCFSDDREDIIQLANSWLNESCFAEFCSVGECKHSTIGFMRYLNTMKLSKHRETLASFIDILKQHRNRKDSWEGFPFFYTLLTLLEIDLPEAKEELRFALPACERRMDRIDNVNKYTQRRLDVIRKVFSTCHYDISQYFTS